MLSILEGKKLNMDNMPQNLKNTIKNAASKYGNEKGITIYNGQFENEYIGYDELYKNSIIAAKKLACFGIRRGSFVILQLDKIKEFINIFWGCMILDAIPIPLPTCQNTNLDNESLRKLKNVYENLNEASIVVEKSKLKEYFINTCNINEEKVLLINQIYDVDKQYTEMKILSDSKINEIAYVQFSSGSTGLPKGVELTHKNITSNLQQIRLTLSIDSKDLFGSWLPLTHNMGMILFHLLPLSTGCNQVLIDPKLFIINPEFCLEIFSKHKISIFGAPNFALKWLNDKVNDEMHNTIDLSNVRIILNGAEPISVEVIERFNSKFEKFNLDSKCITSAYGMSEGTVGICVSDYNKKFEFYKLDRTTNKINNSCENNFVRIVCVGKPFHDMIIKIVNENDEIVEQGISGEILISGPNVTNGYISNECANNNLFLGKYLRTGDIGVIYNDNLLVIGRKKDVIFVNGKKYYSHDLEEVICSRLNMSVEDIVVCGVSNINESKEEIIVFIKENVSINDMREVKEKVQHILSKLIQYYVKDVIIINNIPKTASGKKRREELVKIYHKNDYIEKNNDKNSYLSKVTKDNREIIITKLKEILKVEEIDEEKNFFELGGDSLKLIMFVESINGMIDNEIELEQILNMENLHEIINLIENRNLKEINDNLNNNFISKSKHIFDLTEIQRAYLLGRGENMLLGGVSTHAYFEIKTNLNIKKLNDSLNHVINKNPMLRAIINKTGQQEILSNVPYYEIKTLDLRNIQNNNTINDKLSEYRLRLSHHVHDVYKWPLFDFEAIILNDNESYLFISIDLIIADGLSIRNLLNQIVDVYYGKDEIIDYTFERYLEKVKTIKNSPKYLKAKEYWINKLDDFKGYPKVPLKKNLNDLEQSHFKRIMRTISNDDYFKLKNIASKNNITVSSILCTIFAKVLSEWSRIDNFTLNITTSNRLPLHKDVNKVIGDFTTTILLDVNYHSSESLIFNCNKIKDKIIKGISNSLYDGVNVIRDLNMRNHNEAVFPIVFTSMLFNDGYDNIEKLGEELYCLSQTPQVFLDFQALDKKNNLQLSWDYVNELFEDDVINRMFNQYIDLLIRFINDQNLNKDYFINENNILIKYNDTCKDIKETNIIIEFSKRAGEFPDDIAITHNNRNVTYKELNILSNKVALYLKEKGIQNRDYVIVYTKRNIETIVNILGVLKAGAAYIPVGEDYPENRKNFIFKQSGAKISLDSMMCENIDTTNEHKYNLGEIDSKSTAYCIYTSGSTGKPKGVVISHKAAMNTILDINERLNITNKDIILGISNQTFDLSVYDIFGTLISGAKLVLIDDLLDVDKLISTLDSEKITIWNSVPAIMEMVISRLNDKEEIDYWNDYSSDGINVYKNFDLRVVMLSGDYINVNLPDKIYSKFPFSKVYSLGGATEAGIWSIYYPIEEVDKELSTIPYGYPLSNQQIYILNSELNEQLIGEEGEIYIGGNSLAEGYLNDKERTQKSFINHKKYGGIYKTGDYGRMTNKGYIEFCGRKDLQVKINGHRIELNEIEKVMNNYSDINKCIVAAKNIGNKAILCGYYISDVEISFQNIRSYLQEFLPKYMIPNYLIRIPEIPLSGNGKVNRDLLPLPSDKTGIKEIIEMSSIERDILGIWEEIFKKDNIDINDNFFEIGGDSISMVKMLSKIKDKYNKNIDMISFVSNNTVKMLAKFIEQSRTNSEKIINITPDKNKLYDNFPLTNVQIAYLLGRNKGYNMGGISTHAYYELESELNIEKLNEALQRVIDNHEMLRCTFNSDLTQHFIKEYSKYTIDIIDISFYSKEKQNQILESARENISHQIFDTAEWPLFSFTAYKIDKNKHILIISFDLLIADGISMRLFIKELMENYNNKATESLSFTFRDYMEGIKQLEKTEKYKIDKEYWINRLDTMNTYPKIPFKSLLDKDETPKFRRLEKLINKKEWNMIKDFSKKRGITTSAFLCTTFSYVLGYWSNQWEVLLNMTTFNRYPFHKDVNKMIGDFTSLLMVNISINKNLSFEENLLHVQESILECLDHNSFDGIMVQRELSKKRKITNEPIAPIVFTSMIFEDNSSEYTTDLSEIGQIRYSVSQTSQVFLDFQAMNVSDGLQITWDYVEQLFDSEMVNEIFDGYIKLINNLITQKTHLLELPTRHEYLINKYNKTDREIKTCSLVNLFIRQVYLHPDNIAVSHNESAITYNELDKKSGAVAEYLIKEGVRTGDFVGVITDRSIQTVINVIGVLKAKAAYVPIDSEYPEERKKYIKNKSKCSYVIDNKITEMLDLNGNYLADDYSEDLIAYMIFTSGSTGNPKGVVEKHKAVVNTILDINDKFEIIDQDRILNLSSMCFDLSLYDIFGSLSAGSQMVLIDNVLDIDNILETLEKKEITMWNSVPQIMQMIVERLNSDSSIETNYWEDTSNNQVNYVRKNYTLKNILLSGDKIPVTLPKQIRKYFPIANITSLGGATEASIWSIYYPINDFDSDLKSIPYGYPLANQKIYILDDQLELLPVNVEGEIYIGGKGLAEGYFDEEEKTSKSFIMHPNLGRIYKTGDLGTFSNKGYVEFKGRNDFQVKIRGYRIELGEIENVILNYPKVDNAVVVDKLDNKGNKIICAYIVGETKINLNDLKKYISKYLTKYMIPSYFKQIDMIPLSSNNKVDKKKLPDINSSDENDKTMLPSNKIEQELQYIWNKLLTSRNISVDQNFFDIGGDSITLVRLLSVLESDYGVKLSISNILNNLTIKDMSKLIIKKSKTKNNYSIFNKNKIKTIFTFPSILGLGTIYKELGDYLKDFRIISFDFEPRADLLETYLKEMEMLNGDNSYILLGHSAGGNIAYELAGMLENDGKVIDKLILMDSYNNVTNTFEYDQEKFKNLKNSLVTQYTKQYNLDFTFINKTIEDYFKFLIHHLKIKNLKSDIFYIKSQGNMESMNELTKYNDLWENATKGKFNLVLGHGMHFNMLNNKNANYNAKIIKDILEK